MKATFIALLAFSLCLPVVGADKKKPGTVLWAFETGHYVASSPAIGDLKQRGRLDDTLIACYGEFGRTPKINGKAGRDHWGECGSALFAGGGIRGGQVYGASDAHAAYPTEHPVDPADLHATIYHCMGLDLAEPMYDRLQRPWPITNGRVIKALI